MKNCVCTIVTPDFLANGLATLQSMKKFYKDVDFYILYMDNYLPDCSFKNIKLLDLSFVEKYEDISKKYGIISNETRWCLKPYLIINLLKKYEKVIYVDPDMYFISNWSFLFEEIEGVLLTRHWRSSSVDHGGFLLNFTDGFFNAGFIGCSQNSIEAIEWWADACFWRCEFNRQKGLFVDQRYLDFMYVNFPNVDYCKNQGCNLAGWNTSELKRKMVENELVINEKHKGVFLHFSFISEDDIYLYKFYKKYKKLIEKIKQKLINIPTKYY